MKEFEAEWANAEKESKKIDFAANINTKLGTTSTELKNFAGNLANSIRNVFSQDEIQEAMGTMLFDKTGTQIKQILPVAADLATALGTDLKTAVNQLNQSFSGTATQLGRTFPELKQFTKEELEAGKAIDLVREKVSGMAKEMANSTSGSIKNYKTAMEIITSTVQSILQKAQGMSEIIDAVFNCIDTAVDEFIEPVVRILNEMFAGLIPVIKTIGQVIGASSSAPTASDYNTGDGYLNTSNSKLYIKVGSAWSEQSSVTESNRNMYNLAMKDMLNLAGATGTVAEYATAFVENLFADKATINELQSMSVLFKDYCGSIMSQNPNIGDTMIYMGKNPRLSSVTREFQFAISEYLGKVGQQEMWSDKLITKILASGILALSVMGCVQATEGVYSGVEKYWQETNFSEVAEKNNNNNFGIVGIVDLKRYGIEDTYDFPFYILTNSNKVYGSKDLINYEYINETPARPKTGKVINNKVYILTDGGLYHTDDFINYNRLINDGDVNRIYYWVNKNKIVVTTSDNIVYVSDNDGVTWRSVAENLENDIYFNNEIALIGLKNSQSKKTTDFVNFTNINNPFTCAYDVNVQDNSFIGFDVVARKIKIITDTNNLTTEILGNIEGDCQLLSVRFENNKILYKSTNYNTEENELWEFDIKTKNSKKLYSSMSNYGYSIQNGLYFLATVYELKKSKDYGETWEKVSISKEIESATNITIPTLVYMTSENLYLIEAGWYKAGQTGCNLYISRGREAGSGIIDESFGTEQNYTLNSNGQLMQWGKQTFNRNVDGGNNVAGTAITFPKEFKSEPVVSVTHFNGNQFNMTVRDVSTTGFTPVYRNVNNTSNANTQGCYWIAIGT